MIDPSSSEEESEEESPLQSTSASHSTLSFLIPGRPSQRSQDGSGGSRSSPIRGRLTNTPSTSKVACGAVAERSLVKTVLKKGRAVSPTSSLGTVKTAAEKQALQEKEEEDHKRRLQLYVFVSRCIAYPFNSKQPTDLQRRALKVTKSQLEQIQQRFTNFLKGETQIMSDEAFLNAVNNYYESFLCSDRIATFVASGGCCQNDFREVFRNNVEKRVKLLPEIDGLSKETVLTSWMAKFDCIFKVGEDDPKRPSRLQPSLNSELILTKEQLYDMFQQILGIKKFEHQLLFNVLQLDSSDEQAAAIRRELDGQKQLVQEFEKNKRLYPRFVLKDMETMYVDELTGMINVLMGNLESLPISKGSADARYGLTKLKRYNPRSQSLLSKLDSEAADNEVHLTKMDIALSFTLEVVILEIKGLKLLAPTKNIYCTMEVDGGEKLQTELVEASKPLWDTQGDFTTMHPLPYVKIKLCMESGKMLSIADTELGRVILKPTCTSTKAAEWHKLTVPKNCLDQDVKIKVICRMEKPLTLKHCGFLYAVGKSVWKKWKKRYFVLVQVSQYTFAMCSFKEKRSEPNELMQLEAYTVDYIEPNNAQLMVGMDLEGGHYFFNAVKEGDSILFASDEENECNTWVTALYRATGQAHKPTPLTTSAPKTVGLCKTLADADKARKHGLEEYISADPCKFNHNMLAKLLLKLTLDYRLNDPYCSMGWFSPGQIFILDEYCARYGVRNCLRHLYYIKDLLDRAEENTTIDPHLMHFSYAFCVSHVHGSKGVNSVITTITSEEKDTFLEVRDRLIRVLEHDITNFRYSFPFGRPEGGLKAAISLLERVLMKDISQPPTINEEFRSSLKRCLEKAALLNYGQLVSLISLDDPPPTKKPDGTSGPGKAIDELMRLSGLCVELLQQNEDHYAEAFAWFSDLLVEHSEIFWSLFAVDMDRVLSQQPQDNWEGFQIFQYLNDYLRTDHNLRNGQFHHHLKTVFKPEVIRYMDLMESSITTAVQKGFEREKWDPKGNGCATTEELFWKLDALQCFVRDLHWPEEDFRMSIDKQLKTMSRNAIDVVVKKVEASFVSFMKKSIPFVASDFILHTEVCVMINIILDAKNQALKLCTLNGIDYYQYHGKLDVSLDRVLNIMSTCVINKLTQVLESILVRLARYDDGSFVGTIMNLTADNASNAGFELGQGYINFMRNSMDQIRSKINDELWIINFFGLWYTSQITIISNWLAERLDKNLHVYQCMCLLHVVKKLYTDFELQGVLPEKLDSKTYTSVNQRMQAEEAVAIVIMNERANNASTSTDSGESSNNIVAKFTNVTNTVKGKLGSIIEKSIGMPKFGGGNWF